jgi:hypothetical protein
MMIINESVSCDELVFSHLESFGNAYPSPCGGGDSTNYPCYCDLSVPNYITCPYCMYETTDLNGTTTIICANSANNETIDVEIPTINDGLPKTCSCILASASTDDDDSDSALTTIAIPVLDCGTVSATSCTTLLQADDGTTKVSTPNGESYGAMMDGPCGLGTDWPAFCNTNLANQSEYPYCQFDNPSKSSSIGNNNKTCAKNGESIEFTNSDGVLVQCNCLYFNAALGPDATCIPVSPTMTPTTTTSNNNNNIDDARSSSSSWSSLSLTQSTILTSCWVGCVLWMMMMMMMEAGAW